MKFKFLGMLGMVMFLLAGFSVMDMRSGHFVYADTETAADGPEQDDYFTQADLESDELEYGNGNPQAELDTIAEDVPVTRADAEQARLENEDDKLVDESNL
jgi:hypothetical protein